MHFLFFISEVILSPHRISSLPIIEDRRISPSTPDRNDSRHWHQSTL